MSYYTYYREETQRTDVTDEALMARAQGGDMSAFTALVRRYETRLFNYIRRMVGNASDGEDLFQETFLRVHKHLHKFRTSALFRPWVYRIATNLCRDHLRYRGRRPTISLVAPSGNDPGGSPALDRVEGQNPNPGEVAQGRVDGREVAGGSRRAIGQTPQRLRHGPLRRHALSGLPRARESARRASTANNLKQWGLICKMYSGESHGEVYPPMTRYGDMWVPDLELLYAKYLSDPSILVSPSLPNSKELLKELGKLVDEKPIDWVAVTDAVAEAFRTATERVGSDE